MTPPPALDTPPTDTPSATLPGLGDWQGSSQDLRAGLFLQELHEFPLHFLSLEPASAPH
ncbi:hypothetical protein [Ideonella alba]|uniref:Uncharacterized protein n=1 Tax=Ideonella alba TaxID=2824118 RepID=A0A941BG58_9BURK|nr:hypothetical protein [Ideonella alba]MBQ0930153.1 hypothetical protein [Ideonella alba]